MSKTLVVYFTKKEYTKKVATRIAKEIKADIVNLSEKKDVNLSKYDKIVLGSSVYVGSINRKAKKFIKNNMDVLLSKKLALFMCCCEVEKVQQQFDRNFPKILRKHSFATGFLGGEIIRDKLNFLQNFIITRIHKTKDNVYNKQEDAIKKFISKLK